MDRSFVRRGFWIAQTPVTVAAYGRFAEEGRDHVRGYKRYGQGDHHPMVNVSWDDAVAYCKWAGGRLPTEEEWEHTALAGSSTDPYGPLDEVAWYSDNSNKSTHPVAQKKPNAWGLYDTLGNVWEWCENVCDPESGPVLRGGSWARSQHFLQASYRFQERTGSERWCRLPLPEGFIMIFPPPCRPQAISPPV
jgi:formylglycine-generating enzyme required for sulfatase activity